jgi:hypothetical protein
MPDVASPPSTLVRPSRQGALSRRQLLAASCLAACRPAATLRAQEASPAAGLADPEPHDATTALLAACDRHALVGLSDAHWLQQEHDLLDGLIRHPDFLTTVDAVVVEFGNARYQGVIDRYLAGDTVPRAELVRVWRDTTQLMAWDSPVYERFFTTVREVNGGRPAGERLRVLLGDPPIDWAQIRSGADYERFREAWGGRAPHFAAVVLAEVLARGRKALLVAGSFHLIRLPNVANEAARIDAGDPGALFTVAVHLEVGDRTAEVEAALAAGPVPSLSLLAGTWLGTLPGAEGAMAEEFDAYLYLGPCTALTIAPAEVATYQDEAYLGELRRRHAILSEVGAVAGGLPIAAYQSGGPYRACPA